MSFIQKEEAMLRKLQETDYELFDGEKDEALDFISERLSRFPEYANTVINQQYLMPIYMVRYEGQDYRDHVKELDERRKISHDAACSSVEILNNLSKRLGLEPFADIDTKDRYQVADFVGTYVNEVYNHGIGNDTKDPMYAATKGRESGYDKDPRLLALAARLEAESGNGNYELG